MDEYMDNPFDRIMDAAQKNNEWSASQASIQRNWQENLFQRQMDFNSAQAQLNRDWQEKMSNTAHQREVIDLQKAGLNPILSGIGGNGATVGTGASASLGGVPSGAKGDTDESTTGAIASYLAQMLAAETSIRNTEVSAQAALAGSQLMAAASEYGSMLGFQSAENERKWKTEHPSNPYQLAGSIAGAAGIGIPTVQAVNSALQTANDKGVSKVKDWINKGIGAVKGLIEKGHNYAMKHQLK